MWAQSDFSATYTSNVPLTTTDGTKAELCKVIISETEYDGIKIGTGSAVGACKITVPQNTKYLHMHVAGWNGVTSLSLEVTGIEPAPEDIPVTADTGVKNSSPFTLDGTPSSDDYYTVIEFEDALDSETTLTFTTSGKKRCVIFGVNAEENTSSSTDPALTVNPSSATTFTYEVGEGPSEDQMFGVTGSNLTDEDITASITGDFEMTNDVTYSNADLTLASGDYVAVRLKAGLAKGDYEGTLTFASTGAEDVVINLSGTVTKTDPSITADDVNLAYNATAGSIAYTIDHGVEGGVLTAALTEASTWLTVGAVSESAVAFSATENDGAERTATVRLTYTYDTDKTATKDVTVTQAKASFVITDGVFDFTEGEDYGSKLSQSGVKVQTSTWTAVNVTMVMAGRNCWNTYTNGTQIRLYKASGDDAAGNITLSVPAGYVITYIEFSGASLNKMSAASGTYVVANGNASASWEGAANSIKFTASDRTDLNTIVVTYTNKFTKEVSADGWATWIAPYNVEVPTGVKAYIVDDSNSTKATLAELIAIPAGEPVLLKGAGTHDFTVCSVDDLDVNENDPADNLLEVSDDETTTGVYVLANGGEGVGFYEWTGGSLGAGRVYLPAPANGARAFLAFSFDEEATGVAGIEKMRNVENETFYNLAGQRVAQPTKGLYIVNGKKYIVK